MNKNETIADIRKEAEARFRELLEKHVDSLGHIQAMQQFNQAFDRIEAARSCEVQSLQGTIVKLNDAIAEKQELNENSKSAQFEFCKFQRLLKAVRCLCDEVFNYMKVCNPSVAGGCELRRALENVKDALALFSNSLKENSDAVKTGDMLLAENERMRKELADTAENLRVHLQIPTQTISMNRLEVEAMAKDCEKALGEEGGVE